MLRISKDVFSSSLKQQLLKDIDEKVKFLSKLPMFRMWTKKRMMRLAYALKMP